MVYELVAEKKFVIRVERGEEFISSMEKLIQKEAIEGGFFSGLGASDEFEIAHYDVLAKKYSTKKFSEPYEVTNLTGSIGCKPDKLYVHAHGTFSNNQMQVVGGHIVSARVSGTLEVYLEVCERLEKVEDSETGLFVFKLKSSL